MLTAPAVPDEQAGAARFGLSYQVAEFEPASGWSNVPAGDPATRAPAVDADRGHHLRRAEPQPGL
jgi:hypothetical protein